MNHHTVFLNEPDVHQSIERLAAADKLTIILEDPVNPPERTLSLNTRLVWIDDDGALFDWV